MVNRKVKTPWLIVALVVVVVAGLLIYSNGSKSLSVSDVRGSDGKYGGGKGLEITCTPLTCGNTLTLAQQTCGLFASGCDNNELNCGTCTSEQRAFNHLYLIGCSADYIDSLNMEPFITSCDQLTSGNVDFFRWNFMPRIQESWDTVVGFMGGYGYLFSLPTPFPDVKLQAGSVGDQYYTPDYISVSLMDEYGTKHEMIHWMIRKYSTSNVLLTFEEGFTNFLSNCLNNPNDPWCDNTKAVEPLVVDEASLCGPAVPCNYQSMQVGMLYKIDGYLGCDAAHCWKWFFKNKVMTKNGAALEVNDIYSYLINYNEGNRTAVDAVLKPYMAPLGVDLDTLTPIVYTVPNEAYPGAPVGTCTPSWQCGTWSTCSNGVHTRTCNDANSCSLSSGKPAESEACCVPDWTCGSWTACSNSQQTRTCTDGNSCGVLTDKPSTSQACTITCSPNWTCAAWNTCNAGVQTRVCSDTSSCNVVTGKPEESRTCQNACTPNCVGKCGGSDGCGGTCASDNCNKPPVNYMLYGVYGAIALCVLIALIIIIVIIRRSRVAGGDGFSSEFG